MVPVGWCSRTSWSSSRTTQLGRDLSALRLSLHSAAHPPQDPVNKNNFLAHYESGNANHKCEPGPSLVITRSLNAMLGAQTYMPERLLFGLLPSCLLDDYTFYQNENDSLTGYPKLERIRSEVLSSTPAIIRVQIAGNTAKVTRTRHEDKMPGKSADDMVLLNLLYAPQRLLIALAGCDDALKANTDAWSSVCDPLKLSHKPQSRTCEEREGLSSAQTVARSRALPSDLRLRPGSALASFS